MPQTPAGGVGGKGSGSAGTGSSMVNGSGTDHQDIRDGAAINTEHVSNLSIDKTILSFLPTENSTNCENEDNDDFIHKINRIKISTIPTNPLRNLALRT